MTVSRQDDRTGRYGLDRANINSLADVARKLALGSLLQGQIMQVRRRVNMDVLGANAGNLATLDVLTLTNGGRAAAVLRATVRAGTVTGELTPVAYGTTPATTQIAVAPNGNIVTLAADAITDMDVTYVPERGDVITTVFPVASNVIDLAVLAPTLTTRGVLLLLDVNALVGTVTGRKIVLVPGAGAPATGQARLNVAKSTVTFATADAVTRASVTLLLVEAEPLTGVLEGPQLI